MVRMLTDCPPTALSLDATTGAFCLWVRVERRSGVEGSRLGMAVMGVMLKRMERRRTLDWREVCDILARVIIGE